MKHYSQFEPQIYTSDTIFTFDIETSSYWLTPNGVQGYTEDFEPEEYNDFPCGACCYIWQFSIDDTVYYGRELPEFHNFLLTVFEVDAPDYPIIWVHNLSFEWQFIREYLNIDFSSVFARTPRKPMKFRTFQYNKADFIEFRCSYMLTRLALDVWGQELNCPKLHTLDYTILRTPKTKLKLKELDYAERDCIVVYKGIQQFIEKYGEQSEIPLTQTGEVRYEIRQKMNDKAYHKTITEMLPKTEEEYKLLKSIFQGGSTGGNYLYTGEILQNVRSYDIQSDYPCQMVSQKFPMRRFKYCAPQEVKRKSFYDYAFIVLLEFTNIKSKTCLHYYSRHKAICVRGGKIDNGKIISCELLACCLTEQDLLIFEKCYTWETCKIIRAYKSKKDYLPKKFIEIVLERYCYKTTLKGIENKKELYAQSKQFINSCYGMMVTDLIQESVQFNGNEWEIEENNIQNALYRLQRNRNKNYLNYAWGCWVTAYARARLWIGMLETPEIAKKVVYWDTDSRKVIYDDVWKEIFEKEDKENIQRLQAMCEHYDIDFSQCAPKDQKGKKRIIGAWDDEGEYNDFVHLGAKRYATKTNGKITVTVSGVPKKAGSDMLKDLHDFKDGFVFDANHRDKETGLYDSKMLSTYCDGNNLNVYLNVDKYDEYYTTNKNSIVLRNNGYKLGLADEYKNLILRAKERNKL